MSKENDRSLSDWMVPPLLVPLFLAVLALVYGWLRT
jgi:hypothetical protein